MPNIMQYKIKINIHVIYVNFIHMTKQNLLFTIKQINIIKFYKNTMIKKIKIYDSFNIFCISIFLLRISNNIILL
jgi:hypothetical protein